MPWKVSPMSELRRAFVREVLVLRTPVSQACRMYGVSRKTGYKWLSRQRAEPEGELGDRSRRPRQVPSRTCAELEQRVLEVRGQYGWGAPKIRDHLRNVGVSAEELPCERTIGNILQRHGRIVAKVAKGEAEAPQFFERSQAHALWQFDFKGALEVARRRTFPFTVIDDYSRYLVALRPCADVTMASAWSVLWQAFGEHGLPEEVLSDGAFAGRYAGLSTVSWMDGRLIRLGIRPIHGRPYHPQTQGKVERLHGTLEREVWPYMDRSNEEAFARGLERWRQEVYNPVRPHESLGGRPPMSRYAPSPRRRPGKLPKVIYPPASKVRRVGPSGFVSWRHSSVLVGSGIAGQLVKVEEVDGEVVIHYCWKEIRRLRIDDLKRGEQV